MCAMSVVLNYGMEYFPKPLWNKDSIDQFKQLVKQAEKFDLQTNQPDCVDPHKEAFLEELESWIAEQRA